MNKPQATGYVLVEKTFKEIEAEVDGLNNYDRKTLFEHRVDLGDISEEQKKIQDGNRWWTNETTDMRIMDGELYEYVKKVMYDKLSNGVRENVTADVFNTVMDTKLKTVASLINESSGFPRLVTQTYIGNDKDEEYARLTSDTNEVEDAMRRVKNRTYSMHDEDSDKYILLECVTVQAYAYWGQKITENVKRYIKRLIREDLTYCLKKDKVIIPEEYLGKGKEGIEEWRTIQSGKNKNNSMEKRVLQQVFKDKKTKAYGISSLIMDTLTTNMGEHDWSIPNIQIDGRWNQTRMRKFITKRVDTTDRQKFLNMSDEDMIKAFKEYWKTKLMDAYKAIDELNVEEEMSKRGY